MATAHTPGPWEDWEAANGDDDPAPYRIDGPMIARQSEVVAWVYREHDARIIAAAPELLACVRDLIGCANPNRDRRELRVARALLRRIESPSSGAEAAEPQEGGPA